MDNLDPRLLWFVTGFFGILAVIGFTYLHFKAGHIFEQMPNGSNGKKESLIEKPILDSEKPVLSFE